MPVIFFAVGGWMIFVGGVAAAMWVLEKILGKELF